MVTEELVCGLPILKYNNDTLCLACKRGKQTKGSHPLVIDSLISGPLELLHIDLHGPYTIASLHHKKYILVIVYDFTRFTWVFFLRHKYETL